MKMVVGLVMIVSFCGVAHADLSHILKVAKTKLAATRERQNQCRPKKVAVLNSFVSGLCNLGSSPMGRRACSKGQQLESIAMSKASDAPFIPYLNGQADRLEEIIAVIENPQIPQNVKENFVYTNFDGDLRSDFLKMSYTSCTFLNSDSSVTIYSDRTNPILKLNASVDDSTQTTLILEVERSDWKKPNSTFISLKFRDVKADLIAPLVKLFDETDVLTHLRVVPSETQCGYDETQDTFFLKRKIKTALNGLHSVNVTPILILGDILHTLQRPTSTYGILTDDCKPKLNADFAEWLSKKAGVPELEKAILDGFNDQGTFRANFWAPLK